MSLHSAQGYERWVGTKKTGRGKKRSAFELATVLLSLGQPIKKNQCCTKDSRVTFTLNNPLLSQQSHISFIVLHYSHITSGMLRINHGQAVHVKSFITAFKMFLFWNRHEITKKELERNCISSENRGVWRWAKFHFPCAVVITSNWISKDFETYSNIAFTALIPAVFDMKWILSWSAPQFNTSSDSS